MTTIIIVLLAVVAVIACVKWCVYYHSIWGLLKHMEDNNYSIPDEKQLKNLAVEAIKRTLKK